jgi:tRNA pseudouridine-54 N-methylase
VELRPGLALRDGDLPDVLREASDAPCFVLHEASADLRARPSVSEDAWFFIGDHLGFDVVSLALLERHGCERISVGPVSLHSDDVITLVHNELDRRHGPEPR